MTSRKVTLVTSSLLIACLGLSVPLLMMIDKARADTTLQDVLYIPSPKTVKALSLGYNGLLASIYWTRAVQYFGGKHHANSMSYKLLGPLLDITTTLDPHMVVAYEFGSVFLAQQPPEGAGDPQAAVALVKRGIANNPGAWRLYFNLGFIYWLELHDSKAASQAFLKGSEVPGALPWMKTIAGAMAQRAGDVETSRSIWKHLLESDNEQIRATAAKRLRALRVDDEVTMLQNWVGEYSARVGHGPADFAEMVRAGFIRAVPRDPLGHPYLVRNGRVQVQTPDDFPFITKGLPPDYDLRTSDPLRRESK